MDEWIGAGMYANELSHVGESTSEGFEVKVCVHPNSVLCPLLFIFVLETLSLDSTLGSPGRASMPMTLLSLLNHSRNVSGDS